MQLPGTGASEGGGALEEDGAGVPAAAAAHGEIDGQPGRTLEHHVKAFQGAVHAGLDLNLPHQGGLTVEGGVAENGTLVQGAALGEARGGAEQDGAE